MSNKKQNRPASRAAHVNSVGAGKTIKNTYGEHTVLLALPSIAGFHAEVFVPPTLCKLRLDRLVTQKIIDYASSPNLEDYPGAGADVFRAFLKLGWSFIYWPDGVAILVNSREITKAEGVMLYNAGRSLLESHLNGGKA